MKMPLIRGGLAELYPQTFALPAAKLPLMRGVFAKTCPARMNMHSVLGRDGSQDGSGGVVSARIVKRMRRLTCTPPGRRI